MRVTKVTLQDMSGNILDTLCISPMGDRYYKLCSDYVVHVYTSDGEYQYKFSNGFETNFRSGGVLVDSFIDQIGDKLETQLAWLVHDANYTPCKALDMKHPLGRVNSDKLLRAMLRYAGLSSFKASCVYNSVRLFGGSAYTEDDGLTKMNSELFSYTYFAK